MKLRAVCVCRNEADVIGETLQRAAAFCDEIYVYDLGSTDGTAEIVREHEDHKVHLFDSIPLPFHEGRHADVWHSLRRGAAGSFQPLDWYMILDADEQMIQDPRPVLFAPVYRRVNLQRTWQLNHYFTRSDYDAWAQGDRRPCARRLRFFRVVNLEERFFRWPPGEDWPNAPSAEHPLGCKLPLSCRDEGWRIFLNRHFQYRSPEQIIRRFETRSINRREGGATFPHWKSRPVEDMIHPYEGLSSWDENRTLGNLPVKDLWRLYRWSARAAFAAVRKRLT
jgi:hypothetical protein